MKLYAKNSFSKKLTSSYIVVFLIPLLLSVVVYTTAVSYLHQYSENMLENELRSNKSFVENLLNDLLNVYITTESHASIRAAMAGESLSSSQYNTLKDHLSLATSRNDGLFSSAYVYFENADFVMGTWGGDTAINTYEAYASLYLQSAGEWQSLLRAFHTGDLVATADGILYLKSLQSNADQRAVTLCITIPAARLATLNDSVRLFGETNLLLYDEGGNLLFTSNGELPKTFDLNTLLDTLPEQTPQKITRGGVRYIAAHSSFYHFGYLLLIKEDSIVSRMKLLLLMIFMVTLAAFFIGGFVIRRFVLNQIRPVQEILDLLGTADSEGNEFELIQQNISRNLHYIMQSRSFLADSFITHIIRGDVRAAHPLEFSYAKFQLVLLRVGNMGIYAPEESNDAKSLRDLMHTAVTNIFDELLGSAGNIYHSVQSETIVFLLNTDTEVRIDDVDHAYRQLQDYLGIDAYITLSDVCQNLDEMQTLWQEASRQLDSAEMRGTPGVVQQQNTAPAPTGGGYQKYINLFSAAVADGKPAQAQDVVRSMIQFCAENRKNMNDVKFNLLTMMNDAAQELERRAQADIKSKFYESNIAYKVIEAKSTSLLLGITDEFLTLVTTLPDAAGSHAPLEERIANYIRTHYDDSNLNLKILADKFYKTPAYLSRKFKEHFGVGILDYLASTRLDAAKQKLLETDWSIEQISEHCGYTNTVTFSRQFKSYTAMTPGRFRQAHKLFPPES